MSEKGPDRFIEGEVIVGAPRRFPGARTQYTHVVVRFFEEEEGRTRVKLRHDGWGEGGEWDETFNYFRRAWLEIVLPRLVHRFADGLEER